DGHVTGVQTCALPIFENPMLLAGSLDGLARVTQAQGDLEEAEPMWREVLAWRAAAVGEEHPLYAENLRCLASLHQMRGDLAEARSEERRGGETRRCRR